MSGYDNKAYIRSDRSKNFVQKKIELAYIINRFSNSFYSCSEVVMSIIAPNVPFYFRFRLSNVGRRIFSF